MMSCNTFTWLLENLSMAELHLLQMTSTESGPALKKNVLSKNVKLKMSNFGNANLGLPRAMRTMGINHIVRIGSEGPPEPRNDVYNGAC